MFILGAQAGDGLKGVEVTAPADRELTGGGGGGTDERGVCGKGTEAFEGQQACRGAGDPRTVGQHRSFRRREVFAREDLSVARRGQVEIAGMLRGEGGEEAVPGFPLAFRVSLERLIPAGVGGWVRKRSERSEGNGGENQDRNFHLLVC